MTTERNYIIFNETGITKAVNGITEHVDFSGSNTSLVVKDSINNSPNGGSIAFRAGIYSLQIVPVDNILLIGQGKSTIFTLPNNANSSLITVQDLNNVVIENITLDGNGSNQASTSFPIDINNSSQITVKNCDILNGFSSNIRVTNSSDHVYIDNNRIRSSFGHGISAESQLTNNLYIRNNNIELNNLTGMTLSVSDFKVLYNIIRRNGIGPTSGGSGILVNSSGNRGLIQGNKISESGGGSGNKFINLADGIGVFGKDIRILANESFDNGDTGINISGSRHINSNNKCFLNNNSGVNTGGGNNLIIIGNECYSNGRKTNTPRSNAGIRIRDSANSPTVDIVVIGNICFDDTTTFPLDTGSLGQLYGIEIAEITVPSNFITIIGNDLRNNLDKSININNLDINAINYYLSGNIGYNPQQINSISVGPSPFTYTNKDRNLEEIIIAGGNVTSISMIRNATSTSLGLQNGVILLEPSDAIQVKYTSMPILIKIPH